MTALLFKKQRHQTAFQLPFFCGNWSITARQPKARKFLLKFAQTMQLKPALSGSKRIILELKKNNTFNIPDHHLYTNILIVMLPEPNIQESSEYVVFNNLSALLGTLALDNGAVLLHAALAELNGSGALFMGPGGVGKSTISKRLPKEWRSYSDDTCMVYVDDGQVFAHPWPTWSLFTETQVEKSWDVHHHIPVRSLFFLKQSTRDAVYPTDQQNALNLLVQSGLQVNQSIYRKIEATRRNSIIQEQLKTIKEINQNIRSFYLENTLTGEFWTKIEHICRQSTPEHQPSTKQDLQNHVIYTGPSMRPQFHQAELLTFVPYRNYEAIKKGDVIYFYAPGGKTVIHRVMQKNADKVLTRGDNNPSIDNYWVQFDEIIGRITLACHKDKTRKIARGSLGMLKFYWHQFLRKNNFIIYRMVKIAKKSHRQLTALRAIFYLKKEPQIFVFDQPRYPVFKLYLKNRWIGQYDVFRHQWNIEGIYKLFVDRKKLPNPPFEAQGVASKHE